jgi:signal transduction histidine kinase
VLREQRRSLVPGRVDVLVALSVAGYAAALFTADDRQRTWLDFVMLAAACGALLVRRIVPHVVLATLICLRVWQDALDTAEAYVTLGLFVAIFTAATELRPRASVAIFVAVSAIIMLTAGEAPRDVALVGSTLGFFGAAAGCGISVQRQREVNRQLGWTAHVLEQNARDREAAVVQGERARMRDDLHDIVGHHVNLALVLAQSARVAVGRDDERLVDALAAIDQTCRSALEEMDRATRWLGTAAETAPTPTLTSFESLMASIRQAGVEVDVRRAPPQAELENLDLLTSAAAYRTLQEAMTNVLKHSAERWAQVDIVTRAGNLEITVRSGRPADAGDPARTGLGLAGIRHRLGFLGGTLEVRDGEDFFQQRALIPWTHRRPG